MRNSQIQMRRWPMRRPMDPLYSYDETHISPYLRLLDGGCGKARTAEIH